MILAQDNEGNYIKTGNTSSKLFLIEALADWRPRIITEEEIEEALVSSEKFNGNIFQNIVFDYPSIIIIYCLSNHTEIGAYKCGFRSIDGIMALDLEYITVHPSFRGQGHYSKFAKIMAWFMHQHLKLDIAYYELLKDVPQLVNMAPRYNQEIHYNDVTKLTSIEKFGAVFTYDKFKEGFAQEVQDINIFSSTIPEITYNDRARATNKHKLKKFKLVWNIDGEITRIRRD